MEFGMFASWVVVGLLAGWLAEIVMKDGGYGLIGDMVLGIVGSVVGGWIFWALGVSAGGITLKQQSSGRGELTGIKYRKYASDAWPDP